MKWWACDNGHQVEIPPTTLQVTRMKCPHCIDSTTYRIEVNVPEDDPARIAERTEALRAWLLEESDVTRDRLDQARGALQLAGLPSPHVRALYGTPAPMPGQGVLAL